MILQDKAGIVTGAASGIGRASALALAAEGAAVVLADLDVAGAEAAANAIKALGGRASAVQADVTCDADMAAAVARVLSEFGAFDIAVNAAGGGDRRGPIDRLSEADFDVMIGLNLKGVFLPMRHQLRALAEAGGGSVVNISSTAGLHGIRSGSLYAAAKHGVIGLTRCAALDYAAQGVRVNAVCPGAIETPQFDRVLAASFPDLDRRAAIERMSARYALGRIGSPEEVAELVVWLASEKSAYVTGQAMVVDGGGAL